MQINEIRMIAMYQEDKFEISEMQFSDYSCERRLETHVSHAVMHTMILSIWLHLNLLMYQLASCTAQSHCRVAMHCKAIQTHKLSERR